MAKRKILYGILIFVLILITATFLYLNSLIPIITGYAAKNLCSAVFISGRESAETEALDLNFSFIKYTRNTVNMKEKSVVSRFLWGKSKAIYRYGYGVTLLRDIPEEVLRKAIYPASGGPGYMQDTIKWPLGNILPDTISNEVDFPALMEVTREIMSPGGYNGNAFAFIVLYKGVPVAEAYSPPFNRDTRFLSWSMAASFLNAIVGILVKQGRMDIYKPAGIEEWSKDDRSKITLNDLMQMQSGLKWNEDYGNRSDVTVMLHCESNMSRYAFDRPLEYPAGTHWYYSSGTTNIVSYLIRKKFDNDSSYYTFFHSQLFDKAGMPDAVLEVDPSGTFVGSSYLYASARDYARFGLLFINDGIFNGERILPEGWVQLSTTPANDSKGEYGSFFWLNKCMKLPSAPGDMYQCVGQDGQRIFILPSQNLVVVVLGCSPSSNGGMDFDRLLKDICATL